MMRSTDRIGNVIVQLYGQVVERNYNIMRTPFFSVDPLLRLLRANKIASLPELQTALGTTVAVTSSAS